MDWRLPVRLFRKFGPAFASRPQALSNTPRACIAVGAKFRSTNVRPFASGVPRLQDAVASKIEASSNEALKPPKTVRRKKRTKAAKAQLEKIGKDAGALHIQGLDPRIKRVQAWCVAERYDLVQAQDILHKSGTKMGPCGTILGLEEPQIIHAHIPFYSDSASRAPDSTSTLQTGDVFIFPFGTVVAWGIPTRNVKALTDQILRPAARNAFEDDEREDLEYIEDESETRSFMRGEKIVLGVKPVSGASYNGIATGQNLNGEVLTVLAKIAFSSGLARAAKLSVLENKVDAYVKSTRNVLQMLRGTAWKSRKHVYAMIAELLDLRAQLNLWSTLTDDLPDMFWELRSEYRMENYYDQVGKVLDSDQRIETLNLKMDYGGNIVHELRNMSSEQHSSFLEMSIIVLIVFEVALGLWGEFRAYVGGDPGYQWLLDRESGKGAEPLSAASDSDA